MKNKNLQPIEKKEILFISGDIKDKNDVEHIFRKACELFGMNEDDARELCQSKTDISPSSLVRLAEMLDSSVETDFMKGKVTFYYDTLVLTTKHAVEKKKMEETTLLSVNKKEDDSDMPF